MEKEIVWTSIALNDFWNIVSYLQQNWQAVQGHQEGIGIFSATLLLLCQNEGWKELSFCLS